MGTKWQSFRRTLLSTPTLHLISNDDVLSLRTMCIAVAGGARNATTSPFFFLDALKSFIAP